MIEEVIAAHPEAPYAPAQTRPDGTPVRFDPCRPVRFAINPANAPAGYKTLVAEVLAIGEQASGLRLELVGETSEEPRRDRPAYQPDVYGDTWPPVLIAWTNEAIVPDLVGNAAGLGGSTWTVDDNGSEWFVTGLLYVDTAIGNDVVATRSILLHELGHVLGLGHVEDGTQLMNAVNMVSEFGPGDLAGLAAVGAGPCAGAL